MPENSIWKLHLISFLPFKQSSVVSAFWWFSSNFVWYLYDYLKKAVLCFKAVRTFRAEQQLNEAFMSSCLPKTKWWVPAGWVQVKAEAVVHSHPRCAWSATSSSSSAWPYAPMRFSTLQWVGWKYVKHAQKAWFPKCTACLTASISLAFPTPVSKLVGDLCLNLWQQLT